MPYDLYENYSPHTFESVFQTWRELALCILLLGSNTAGLFPIKHRKKWSVTEGCIEQSYCTYWALLEVIFLNRKTGCFGRWSQETHNYTKSIILEEKTLECFRWVWKGKPLNYKPAFIGNCKAAFIEHTDPLKKCRFIVLQSKCFGGKVAW